MSLSLKTIWPELPATFARAEAAYEPLSESDLVQRALSFANGETAGDEPEFILPWFPDLTKPKKNKAQPESANSPSELLAKDWRRFVTDLGVIASGGDVTEITKRTTRAAQRVLLVPHYETFDGNVSVRYRYLAEDAEARLAYVTLLLLDNERDFRRRLCQCQLQSCGNFFWERRNPQGGKPGRMFCSPLHMQEHHDLQTADRVRRHREKSTTTKKKTERRHTRGTRT